MARGATPLPFPHTQLHALHAITIATPLNQNFSTFSNRPTIDVKASYRIASPRLKDTQESADGSEVKDRKIHKDQGRCAGDDIFKGVGEKRDRELVPFATSHLIARTYLRASGGNLHSERDSFFKAEVR